MVKKNKQAPRGQNGFDPSFNVNALVDAAIQRQDDLREKDTAHLKEIVDLRAKYDDQLRIAESRRIDAIRAVDVAAVASSARDAALVAQTLATQVQASAEALRGQVDLTKTAAAAALVTALEPIQKDVSDLRRVQYEQVGSKSNEVESKNDRSVSTGLWVAIIGLAITTFFAIGTATISIATLIILTLTHTKL